MKILYVYGHDWGGAFVLTQMSELIRDGHDVVVICPAEGPFTSACKEKGIPAVVSPFQGSSIRDVPRIIKSMMEILKYIRGYKPDVIHYHLIKATIVGRICGFIAGVPRRYSQLGGPLSLEMWNYRWLDLITSVLDTGIICPSIGVMNIYGRYRMTRRKLHLLYYGFDQSNFAAAGKGDRIAARADLGLAEDDLVVILVAYMYGTGLRRFKHVSLKGHETLIGAARAVLSRHPKAKFLIVGEDPDGSRLNFSRFTKMVEDLGLDQQFVFTGLRKDVPDLLALADLAVVTSLSENCGGAVEPFAVGIPVVASDTGGLPELVLPEITGFRFRPGDSSGLAQALDEALALSQQERRELGENGRRLVRTLFDPALCREAQLAIYRGESPGQTGQYQGLVQSLSDSRK